VSNDNSALIVLGLGAVAFYGYEQGWFSSLFPSTAVPVTTPVTVTTPVSTTTTSSSTSPVSTTTGAPSVTQQLQSAAGSVSTLDADQWSYYWTQIGQTALSSDQFGSIFFPTGRPASQSSYPQYTAAQFIAALSGAGVPGVSGLGWLGNYGGIPVAAIHGGW
jgi:hypothetical protein